MRGTRPPQESEGASIGSSSVGKRTLVEQLEGMRALDGTVVQCKADGEAVESVAPPKTVDLATTDASADIAAPLGGVNLPGFIDTSDGANLRTGPAEMGGRTVIDAPLPPATRVFVSGTHPITQQWWYVTAFMPDQIARGYVQQFRVNTDLPEPLAKLHQVKSGDTVERLAAREYASAVRDGHDLRYYENVLLFVNRQRGRVGLTGTYQDPGLLGGGANNIQLVAGHRIWLVSPAYAHAMEGAVPDGSLTNGVYAKVKRFVQHVVDLIKSVTQSSSYVDEVAGEYAQAIRDHLPEIIGIVAGFIAAEAASAFLAATPTGVGQIAAVLIQLVLAAFGAAGMAEAGIEALKHAQQWLTLAWTAKGSEEKIGTASCEFLRMLVSVAIAALAYAGVRSNLGGAVKISQAMPPAGMAPALAGAGVNGGPVAAPGEAIKLGVPSPAGSLGTAASMKMQTDKDGGGGSDRSKSQNAADQPAKLDELSFAANAKGPERVTAERVAARAEFKGRTFRAPPSPDPGFDWVDDLGRTFDAMGDGTKSKYFQLDRFKASIDHHLRKGNTFTVIDMTGYAADQISAVRAYVDTLPAGNIIRVGF
jgi:hypothetical protein